MSKNDFNESFNLAPTEMAPIIAYGKDGLSLINSRFGLIPSWTKDKAEGATRVNARSETVDTLKSFAQSFKKHHCLVPVSGFYEWDIEGKIKQPYLFERKDHKPMFLAGLWDYWKPESILSHTIMTTEANTLMQEYHSRMPVILDESECLDWLDSKPEKSLLDAYPSHFMSVQQVSTGVNNVRHKVDVLQNSA